MKRHRDHGSTWYHRPGKGRGAVKMGEAGEEIRRKTQALREGIFMKGICVVVIVVVAHRERRGFRKAALRGILEEVRKGEGCQLRLLC